ncbi:MAG: UPF0149 family protein [Gammaproteobacteria bacterium]|nr:UPF0149 family protein [Gammaproteobacteria bacterium]
MSEIDIQYDEITDSLKRISVEQDAAEVHGALCGLFCTVNGLNAAYWLDNTLTNAPEEDAMTIDALNSESRSLLTQLFSATEKQLKGEDFDFQLFLPDDNSGLYSRVEALSNWCQGFLYGLSQGGLTDPEGLPGELPEIIKDIVEISRAESYELDDDTEDEKDFMELVEFVRVAIQLFVGEMQQFQVEEPDDDSEYH